MYRPPANRKQIYDKLLADVKTNLPTSNPQKKQSWIRALLSGFTEAFWDMYFQLTASIDTYFSDTTYGIYLIRKMANNGIFLLPARPAKGELSLNGTVGIAVPAGTLLTGNTNSIQYSTLTEKTIIEDNLSITSLAYASGIATAITTANHDLVLDDAIVVAGATPSELNGSKNITAIIDAQTFQYSTETIGSGTATGTIELTINRAIVTIESDVAGAETNLSLNEELTLLSPIIGINNITKVTYDEVSGGSDVEDEESGRERLIEKQQNPVTLFNPVQISVTLKELAFVERVFVYRITPDVGQVTIYILKENNVLPTGSELQQAKDYIQYGSSEEKSILPANTSIDDVFILAPTPLIVDFAFSSITPNTATMKTSIQNKLIEFFNSRTMPGFDISEKQYECAILSTIDTATGDILDDFTLTTPTGDIIVASNEIGVLGNVTFA